MNPIVRNILAVILGIVACFVTKMVVMSNGWSIFPPPEGMNPNDLESWKAFAHLIQPKHLITPFVWRIGSGICRGKS